MTEDSPYFALEFRRASLQCNKPSPKSSQRAFSCPYPIHLKVIGFIVLMPGPQRSFCLLGRLFFVFTFMILIIEGKRQTWLNRSALNCSTIFPEITIYNLFKLLLRKSEVIATMRHISWFARKLQLISTKRTLMVVTTVL